MHRHLATGKPGSTQARCALGQSGGRTITLRPQPSSPAIDSGSDYAVYTVATNERGLLRICGAKVNHGEGPKAAIVAKILTALTWLIG